MTKRGFTIFEFLTYITLFALLATCSVSWIVQLWGTFLRQSQSNSALIGMYTAQDCLLRDLRTIKEIYGASKKGLIFASTEKDIGYTVENQTLIRSEGTYDPIQDRWTLRTKSTITRPIKSLQSTASALYIEFSLISESHTLTNRVHRKNRDITWKATRKEDPL